MTEFDKLWNYNQPAETELKFREALQKLSADSHLSVYLQLKTQIARTNSLQQKLDEAHAMLNEVETQLPEKPELAHVRYFLERGRTFNSAGNKQQAEICFRSALDISKQLSEDFYTIDTIHMLAIVAQPNEAIRLNEEAIVLAENSVDERAKGWLGSLYNNLGWSYFDRNEYEKALSIFLRALQWRLAKEQPHEIFLAKWCVARTLRALNKLNEAITIQLGLFEELVNTDTKDGYVYEELAELYLLKGDAVHKMYFQLAYDTLSTDTWLATQEPKRIQRLKNLAG